MARKYVTLEYDDRTEIVFVFADDCDDRWVIDDAYAIRGEDDVDINDLPNQDLVDSLHDVAWQEFRAHRIDEAYERWGR